MKIILFLLLPIFCFSQQSDTITTFSSYGSSTVVCSRTHIDTVKNVAWYVSIWKDTARSEMPMSTGCPKGGCTFLHTWNDNTKESRWFEMYHKGHDGNDWAYYIHEVFLVALKQYDKPIIYPDNH
jgi:hypothetical protein